MAAVASQGNCEQRGRRSNGMRSAALEERQQLMRRRSATAQLQNEQQQQQQQPDAARLGTRWSTIRTNYFVVQSYRYQRKGLQK